MNKMSFLRQYFVETYKENFTKKEVLEMIEVFCEPLIGYEIEEEIKRKFKETFPPLTAKEIIEQCDNTVDGIKILWSIDWYKDEDFFTKEKCRPISMEFTELKHLGKSWNEINKLGKMFNFAEIVYLMTRFKKFREMLKENYIWTESRASDGGLVDVGSFDAGGACVGSDAPDIAFSRIN